MADFFTLSKKPVIVILAVTRYIIQQNGDAKIIRAVYNRVDQTMNAPDKVISCFQIVLLRWKWGSTVIF